jgi:hypothetical protein
MLLEIFVALALAGPQVPAVQVPTTPAPAVQAPTTPLPAVQAPVAKPPAAPLPAALTAFWESEATSRGGIGTAMLINADGTCEYTVTVKVPFKYTFDAGKLTFAGDEQGTPASTLDVTLTGDTLVVRPPVGDPLTKARIGAAADPAHPIVGIWRYPHASGGTAWERYGADGTMEFRLPMSERPAACTVTLDRLSIISPQMKTDARFEVKGGELRLFGAADAARLFRRVTGGRWYGRADLTPAIK